MSTPVYCALVIPPIIDGAALTVEQVQVVPSLEGCAALFSAQLGRTIDPNWLTWAAHSNQLYVSMPIEGMPPVHCNQCQHRITLRGLTVVFWSPVRLRARGDVGNNFYDWVADIDLNDKQGNEKSNGEFLQNIFANAGPGNIELLSARQPIRNIDGDPVEITRLIEASGASEPSPLEKLLGMVLGGQVHEIAPGISAIQVGSDDDECENEICPDQPTVPWVELARWPNSGLTIEADVSYDPTHFPSPLAFIQSLMASYMRLLTIQTDAEIVSPEVGEIYLDMWEELFPHIQQIIEANPGIRDVEQPMLPQLPFEEDTK